MFVLNFLLLWRISGRKYVIGSGGSLKSHVIGCALSEIIDRMASSFKIRSEMMT